MLGKYSEMNHASLNHNTVKRCHKTDADGFMVEDTAWKRERRMESSVRLYLPLYMKCNERMYFKQDNCLSYERPRKNRG